MSAPGCTNAASPSATGMDSATGGIDVTVGPTSSSTGDDSSTGEDTDDGSTGGFPGLPTTGTCSQVEVSIDPVVPTLVLLVDQSGSMDTDFEGVERWDAVYETLMEPSDGVVANLQGQVRFGLTLYSSERGFEGGECPMLTSVAPTLDNFDDIDAVYGPAELIRDTPTGESLEATAQMLAALDLEGPKAIVLATDGAPDTCDNHQSNDTAKEVSVAAGQAAWDLGIQTFVVSVGDDVGDEHLQEMANVGVGKDPDAAEPAPFFKALNPEQLVEAFDEIVGEFVTCSFTVDGEVDLERACDGTVTLDGETLECGTQWHVPDPSTLELLGDACETLKDGQEHDLDARWSCGVFTPVG